ncbi:hypothetical protein [Pengzhenrongella phosphoraccumulans]|uniref:hypothetical protein n=1 Tax=Pengzhenrongella phosphoraccumulans TaxID=3114394 RepID=UPI00388E5E63
MDVIAALRNLIRPEAVRLNYFRVPDTHVIGESISPQPARSQEVYFQVSALSVHLAHDRFLTKTYIPGVAAVVTTSSAGGTSEFIRVAGSNDLAALESSSLGRTILVNKAVSPLLPFTGGSVEVIMGLVAFQNSDAMPGLLNLVSSVTGLVGGPAAAAAAGAVGNVVAQGLDTLLGSGKKNLVLSLDHRWTGAEDDVANSDTLVLREGFWVLLNEESRFNDDLWIKDGQLMRGDAPDHLAAVAGIDYMVLRIDTRVARDDWESFCGDELNKRQAAADRGDPVEAVAQNRAAMAKIANSAMFTRADKQRLGAMLRAWSPTAEVAAPADVAVSGNGGPSVARGLAAATLGTSAAMPGEAPAPAMDRLADMVG